MPRSVQAFRQNAKLTHSPNNTMAGDPTAAVDDGSDYFKVPSFLDICNPVTQNNQNPFMAGLNTMGDGTNSSGVPGQTGNILSGLQIFSDTLCGMALGGGSASEVLNMARQLRAAGGDLGETIDGIRKLRATVGLGTSPQSVLAGVQDTSNAVNSHPFTGGLLSMGGSSSGNQFIDALNGLTSFLGALCSIGTGSGDVSATTPDSVVASAQSIASNAHFLLSGRFKFNANGNDLFDAGARALRRNTALHFGNQSLSTAQSVALQQQNLLVSDDFSASTTVVGDAHWTWDGTDGSPGTAVLGCASVTCDGTQPPLVSSEIPVVAGEEIEVACEIKWSGLTYTGDSPLVLAVEKYRLMKDPAGSGQNVYTDIGWYEVYTVPSPGASSGWVGVAGTYTVETGVDQLRFRLDPKQNATAGVVKFDAAAFLKLSLIGSECVPFTGETVDNIVTKLYGVQGTGFSQNAAAVALANTASSLSSVNSRLAALEAEGHTGALAGDDFNWTGQLTANANWGGVYSQAGFGTYQANGLTAAFVETAGYAHTGINDCRFNWIGTDSVSETDYQLVQCVINSPPDSNDKATAYLYLFGRISSDWENYILLKIGGDGTYQVIRAVAGVETVMDSGTCAVPGNGSTITLYCGDAPTAALRKFTAKIGSQTISSFTESGSASQVGTAYRGWGFGGLYNKYALFAPFQGVHSVLPPSVDQWLAMDQ